MNNFIGNIIKTISNINKIESLQEEVSQIKTILSDRRIERSERRRELLINSVVALLSGAFIAWFSVWVANTSNKNNLESLVDVNFGLQDELGLISVSTQTPVKIYVENIGPNEVQNVRLNLGMFHSDFSFDKIELEPWAMKPLYVIKKMKIGEKRVLDLKELGYVWENIFVNEENPLLKSRRKRDFLLFCRLNAEYNRSWDNKLFSSTNIYLVYRKTIVPWHPINKDRFLPDDRF